MNRAAKGRPERPSVFNRQGELAILGRSVQEMVGRIKVLLAAERRLLTDVSHELKSPLTRLGLAVKLLDRETDRLEATRVIRKEAGRMNALIGKLSEITGAEGDR